MNDEKIVPSELDCCLNADELSRCEVFINVSNRFIGLLGNQASRASRNSSQEYPFVAMDSRQVFRQLTLARRHFAHDCRETAKASTPPSFIDVGCGIGNVMLLAEQLGFKVYGLEKDPEPCAIARRLFDQQQISNADIWDYQDYSQFQVIYYFRPFSERDLQSRFERMIEDKLQPGGVLIANHKNSEQISGDRRFSKLHPDLPVWCKTKP